ncbi:two-component sensor histidine kinase/PAS domain-containing protein [Paenibacillus sp. V4I3]|uniref:sensor histidine kinase n=1 Tax=Paenibacillus sp. V4I3 TaxID=3042305 RepID=UPI00277F2E25|nr:sensor histidine kinase [Paenibacillus sp. V4I3]MDQ0871540.1 two-component sensor histidine kinase/PAS domain-containing protein [Paenibacillus sp. V4I3]
MVASIIELCRNHTILSEEEAQTIKEMAAQLQLIADVSESDVFIDCPLADKGSALVVAEAHPSSAPSLYKTSVVGQYAFAQNEPAVMFCLLSGQSVIGSRGISQEQIAIQQNVVPIRSKGGNVIGALIMEKDISEKLEQEKNVTRLMETTEQLSETLLTVAMSEGSMQSLMHEGIVLFDDKECVTYTNPRAAEMLKEIGHAGVINGYPIAQLFYGRLEGNPLIGHKGLIHQELQIGHVSFDLKAMSIYRDQREVGGIILIRDISDIKEKEKQLVIKSAVIKEIHHRVKNNLQTVSSLLRLQMRRTKLEEVERVYRDSINRINSIAVIHEMLAFEGIETIHFNDVVDRITKNIISSSSKPDQNIYPKIYGDELILQSDVATTLALVVNELVQNCVLHAFGERRTGNIDISLQFIGTFISVHVSDNGIGIEAAIHSDRKGHLGLKITETLVEENLGGIINMTSDERGTDVHITFPLSKTQQKEDE